MAEGERTCKICGISQSDAQLEKCGVCSKYFCATCSHRAYGGRRFCSTECARGYYFHGEVDDEDTLTRHNED